MRNPHYNQRARMNIRVPHWLHAEIRWASQRQALSMAAYARNALADAVRQDKAKLIEGYDYVTIRRTDETTNVIP